MKTLILWTVTILGLSGIFLLFKAPFIGAIYLLILLGFALLLYRLQTNGSAPILWIYPKLTLAISLVSLMGYSLYLYVQSRPCPECMYGILAHNIPLKLPMAEKDLTSFVQSLYQFHPKLSFCFAVLMVTLVGYVLTHRVQKHMKRRKHHA